MVLKNVTDFISLNDDLIRIVGQEGFARIANKSNIIMRSNIRAHFEAVKSYLMNAEHDFHSYLLRFLPPFHANSYVTTTTLRLPRTT